QSLLVWRNTFFVLNLSLYVVNGIGALNLQGDGFPSQGLNKCLHASSQTQNQVQGCLL
ncbi:hypothetical protein SLEP1_g60433, partial [Rubroshorea leprosula]